MATTAPQPPAKASPPSAPRRISLALQGGGSHGAFTWGVLDRLLEDERLEIAAVSGTSAGAMNAAALAAGHAQGGRQGARRALDKFWHSTAQQALLSPMRRTPLDRLLGRWNRVQCFALSGTYRSQKKACGKARLAAHAGGLGKRRNAAASLFLAARRASAAQRRCAGKPWVGGWVRVAPPPLQYVAVQQLQRPVNP